MDDNAIKNAKEEIIRRMNEKDNREECFCQNIVVIELSKATAIVSEVLDKLSNE